MKCRYLLILAFLFLFIRTGCDTNRIDALPDEIHGEWRTSAERFDGFTFRLTNEAIVFIDQNAENPLERYPISKIEKESEQQQTLYTIFYKGKEDVELKFAFYHEQQGSDILRLKNQKGFLWKKE